MSGATDCYQPAERQFRLTRGCLEVCAEYKNPVAVITKAPLIERDLDVLLELKRVARASVTLSIPLWQRAHAHALEPFVATPQRRMETVARLAKAGIEVGVNIAPMIPGLGDEDIAEILQAAKDAGCTRASVIFLRLPGSVKQVFEERLRAALPLRADRVLNRVRDARGGKLYDARWGFRQVGQGPHAEAAQALFDSTVRRLGFNTGERPVHDGPSTFRRPGRLGPQLDLL
jgi:DNA repair photolyase